jgi:hypothetical protein
MSSTDIRTISISTYLSEVRAKNIRENNDNSQYNYGIELIPGNKPLFQLIIRKEDKSVKSTNGTITWKEVFRGPLKEENFTQDMYYVEFKKAGIKAMVYFFM